MKKRQKLLYDLNVMDDKKSLLREISRINRATFFDNIIVKIFACIIIAFAEANIIYTVLRDTLEMGVVESITIILAVALVLVFLPHSIGHMLAERHYENSGSKLLLSGAIIFYVMTLAALVVPRIFFYLERGDQQAGSIVDLSAGTAIGAENELTSLANMSMVGVLFVVMISCGFVLALISFKASDPLKNEIVNLTMDKFYVEQEIKLRRALDAEFQIRMENDERFLREEDEHQLRAAITEIHYVIEKIRQKFLLSLAQKRNKPEDIALIMDSGDTDWIDGALDELIESHGSNNMERIDSAKESMSKINGGPTELMYNRDL